VNSIFDLFDCIYERSIRQLQIRSKKRVYFFVKIDKYLDDGYCRHHLFASTHDILQKIQIKPFAHDIFTKISWNGNPFLHTLYIQQLITKGCQKGERLTLSL
jgi:hypothetical protein